MSAFHDIRLFVESVFTMSHPTLPIVHESFPIVATIGSETNQDMRAPSCVRPKILKVYVSAGIRSMYQVYPPGVVGEAIRSMVYVVTS